MRDDAVKMTLYRVSGKPILWSSEMEETVGYYNNEDTAQKVVNLVKDAHKKEVPVDVKFEKITVLVSRDNTGSFYLKDGPDLIRDYNREEMLRVTGMRFAARKMLPTS